MAKRYENETYIEWYARNLGSVHSYSKDGAGAVGPEGGGAAA